MATGSKAKGKGPAMPKATATNVAKRKRLKKSPSPKPNSSSSNNNKLSVMDSPILPPPSSMTPSRSSRRSKKNITTPNDHANSSPLNAKQIVQERAPMAQSSPIRQTRTNSLPSPSPDVHHTSKSSPIKLKKVMFNDGNLINFDKSSPIIPNNQSPKKSILKPTTRPPLMNPLLPQTSLQGSLVNPSQIEFWTPGNIPRLTNPTSSNHELIFFKNVVHGGITVLESSSCDKHFEIYATINLLLKDLNDRKIITLLDYLPDLIRLLKRDMTIIENQIISTDTLSKDPFLVRTDIQITKILTQLISNTKIINSFWKKSKSNFEYVRWCIIHSSSIILKPTVSKSLLTANLQLLKDHKVHQQISMSNQEYILYALLNMKYFNSSSLLVERLYTLKSLIINHTIMMEKNAKTWLPFLFNCLCDFNSQYQKQQQVAIQTLLESSKVFITSKTINFEIKMLLNSPIHKTLQIAPDSQISLNSTPLDLQQSTFTYITCRIEDLLQDQVKVAMDFWLGLTILVFNDSNYLQENPIEGSPWYGVLEKCLIHQEQVVKKAGVRAFRGLVYVVSKNLKLFTENGKLDSVGIERKLELMFSGFEKIGDDYTDLDDLVNLSLQMFYVLLNNPQNVGLDQFIWKFIIKVLDNLQKRSKYLEKICVMIFSHLVGTPSSQAQRKSSADNGFYLIKCLGTDKFELNDINRLSSEIVLDRHDVIYEIFKSLVWDNPNETLKVKVNCLSNLLNSFKPIAQKDTDLIVTKKIFQVIDNYSQFAQCYFEELVQLSSADKLDYINKLVFVLKTTFGYRIFYKCAGNDEVVFNNDNIFVKILKQVVTLGNVKPTDVLKFMTSLIKTFQYRFYESLVISIKDQSIIQYLSNNLESKIFEKSLAIQEIQSIGNVIAQLPKSRQLLINYLSYIIKNNITNGVQFMNLRIWQVVDLISLSDMINDEIDILKTPLIQDMVMTLRVIPTETALKLFNHWRQKDQLELLLPFTEHIYFHVMDPNSQYSKKIHIEGYLFLQRYMKLLKESHLDNLDDFVLQGLEICKAMQRDGQASEVVFKVQDALTQSVVQAGGVSLSKCKQFLEKSSVENTQIDKAAYKEVSSSDLSMEQQKQHDARDVGISIDSNSSDREDEKDTVVIESNKQDVEMTQDAIETPTSSAEKPSDDIEATQQNEDNGSTQATAMKSYDVPVEDAPTQVIETQDTATKAGVQRSSSIELTSDWNDANSSDHEFFDARAHVELSPVKERVEENSELSTSDDAFYDSHEDISMLGSKELVEPINQVVETQETPDFNEIILPNQEEEESNDKSDDFNQLLVEDKENEIPSDSLVLYSSPLKNVKRKSSAFNERVNELDLSPIKQADQTNIQDTVEIEQDDSSYTENVGVSKEITEDQHVDESLEAEKVSEREHIESTQKDVELNKINDEVQFDKENEVEGDVQNNQADVSNDEIEEKTQKDQDDEIEDGIEPPTLPDNSQNQDHPEDISSDEEDDEDDIVEIDDREFTQSIRDSSSPRKRPESSNIDHEEEQSYQPNKKLRLEDNSALDILTPPDFPPVPTPVEQVSKMFDGFTDEQISKMDDKEVYEMENKLLAFMMRMRNRTN